MKKLVLTIAFIQGNRGIGYKGTRLYVSNEDMKFFRETTKGDLVMMGYHTWKDIKPQFRPLKGRINIVITKEHLDEFKGMPDVYAFSDMDHAMAWAQQYPLGEHVWIIGGESLYAHFLPICKKLYLTETLPGAPDLPADRFFPNFSETFALKGKMMDILSDDKIERYTINVYERAA